MYTHSHDLHSAPVTEKIAEAQASGVNAKLVKLQSSKTDLWYSLHVAPNSFSLNGVQLTDMLSYIGFERSNCPYHPSGGYCREVGAEFDVTAFTVAIGEAYEAIRNAERHLNACGYVLTQTEGWGFFHGTHSRGHGRSRDYLGYGSGDGHTSPETQFMKEAQDDFFTYKFTWIQGGRHKGWVTHFRPQHPPMSADLLAAIEFLGIQIYKECPQFDFDECYWSFREKTTGQEDFFGAEAAHRYFDAHGANFADGLKALVAANAKVEPFGLSFLPASLPTGARTEAEIEERVLRRPGKSTKSIATSQFDVAVSFAGPNRAEAETLATIVRDAGFDVFYDNFYPEQLWGKNGVDLFDDIYRKRSRHCVMFVSQEYAERMWTNVERKSAQARAAKEKGDDYILPIRVDDTDLPGLPPTTLHMSLKDYSIQQIAELLVKRLRSST